MKNPFKKPKAPEPRKSETLEDADNVIKSQRVESAQTLDYVRDVLSEKDRLLTEALNQTGNAVRQTRRPSPARVRPAPR